MRIINSSKEKDLLDRIVKHLILNTSILTDLGLYHGKAGIAIFFAHYAEYTGDSMYNDFAGELLDEIYEEIQTNVPVDFENGLCGIAWGIHYLLQNNFMEGNSCEVLEDIDNKIMEYNILRIKDKSFKKGVAGIFYYVKSRLADKKENANATVFDKNYLNNLKKIALQSEALIPSNVLYEIIKEVPDTKDLLSLRLGLWEGCAGKGLKMIL